jgi:hypothetical protein
MEDEDEAAEIADLDDVWYGSGPVLESTHDRTLWKSSVQLTQEANIAALLRAVVVELEKKGTMREMSDAAHEALLLLMQGRALVASGAVTKARLHQEVMRLLDRKEEDLGGGDDWGSPNDVHYDMQRFLRCL